MVKARIERKPWSSAECRLFLPISVGFPASPRIRFQPAKAGWSRPELGNPAGFGRIGIPGVGIRDREKPIGDNPGQARENRAHTMVNPLGRSGQLEDGPWSFRPGAIVIWHGATGQDSERDRRGQDQT